MASYAHHRGFSSAWTPLKLPMEICRYFQMDSVQWTRIVSAKDWWTFDGVDVDLHSLDQICVSSPHLKTHFPLVQLIQSERQLLILSFAQMDVCLSSSGSSQATSVGHL